MNTSQEPNKDTTQLLQPPPKLQRDELISSLAQYELLEPLLKALAETEYIAAYQLNANVTLTDQEAAHFLSQELKANSQEQVNAWRQRHGLLRESDLLNYARFLHKKNAVITEILAGSGESLFLRYKDRLDRVLYSLIRVESEDLAHALYYAIEDGEFAFGEAAEKHSIGPESKTQGIIGPVDLTTPHPEIAARLRTATARQLFPPFQADQWHAIIRLEYRFDSEFDEKTKHFLGSLLLTAKSQDTYKSLLTSYLTPEQ